MKKSLCFMLAFMVLVFLSGCSKAEYMDMLYFTDNLNCDKIGSKVQMSDYFVKDNIYTLPIKKDGNTVIIRAVTDVNGDIGEIRVTMAKTDEKGQTVNTDGSQRALFCDTVKRVLAAYAYTDAEVSDNIVQAMKLDSPAPYTSVGEITGRRDNYYFVLFSTDIAVSFTVKNIHISPVEKTQKPESRPAFGNTTNIRTETVPLR